MVDTVMPQTGEAMQDQNRCRLPAAAAAVVGPARTASAEARAAAAIDRLDRDNHWTQEPAHVFRADSWKVQA